MQREHWEETFSSIFVGCQHLSVPWRCSVVCKHKRVKDSYSLEATAMYICHNGKNPRSIHWSKSIKCHIILDFVIQHKLTLKIILLKALLLYCICNKSFNNLHSTVYIQNYFWFDADLLYVSDWKLLSINSGPTFSDYNKSSDCGWFFYWCRFYSIFQVLVKTSAHQEAVSCQDF